MSADASVRCTATAKAYSCDPVPIQSQQAFALNISGNRLKQSHINSCPSSALIASAFQVLGIYRDQNGHLGNQFSRPPAAEISDFPARHADQSLVRSCRIPSAFNRIMAPMICTASWRPDQRQQTGHLLDSFGWRSPKIYQCQSKTAEQWKSLKNQRPRHCGDSPNRRRQKGGLKQRKRPPIRYAECSMPPGDSHESAAQAAWRTALGEDSADCCTRSQTVLPDV